MEFDSAGDDVHVEFEKSLGDLKDLADRLEIELLLSGKEDPNNAILTIHPGAGGTESQDWASILYRMYVRYAERHGYTVQLFDYQDGDTAGLNWEGTVAGPDRLRFLGVLSRYAALLAHIRMDEAQGAAHD